MVGPSFTSLVQQLRSLPDEAFLNLQYLQTQVGCPNACPMCSQGASKSVTAMTARGLRDLLDALEAVIGERFAERDAVLGRGRSQHKPGVIFPYLDTDVGSDRRLFELVQGLYERFGSKVRISTIGYSRHNPVLQSMHERIASHLPQAVDGFRLSLTPYTYGMHNRAGQSTRAEYTQDLANLLRTYRPLLTEIGAGKDRFAVELRSKPLVQTFCQDLDEIVLAGHHVLRTGPYLLVGCQRAGMPRTATLAELKQRTAEFSQPPLPYVVAVSDSYINEGDWAAVAGHLLAHARDLTGDPSSFARGQFGRAVSMRRAGCYRFENMDGPYYAIDPTFLADGTFKAVSFYGQTTSRRVSGYNDATRPLLNTLVAFKKSRGVARWDDLPGAAWQDVDAVLRVLRAKAEELRAYDVRAAEHLANEILPLIETYVCVLKVGSSRVDLQACKLEYSIVSPK